MDRGQMVASEGHREKRHPLGRQSLEVRLRRASSEPVEQCQNTEEKTNVQDGTTRVRRGTDTRITPQTE